MMKELIKNVLLVLAAIAAALAGIEIGIRAIAAVSFPRMMELDDVLGWRHATNRTKKFVNENGEPIVVRHNRFGHRGPDRSLEKPAGVRRILVLGDSFTEAVQVSEEDSFSGRIEAARSDLEVWNAGVGGYGTVQQYLYFETEARDWDIDLVLVVLYENDFADNCMPFSPGFGPRPYASFAPDGLQIYRELDYAAYADFALRLPLWQQLNRHSYLYNFVNTRIYQKLNASAMQDAMSAEMARVRSECATREIVGELLARINGLVRKSGARLAGVLVPTAVAAERGEAPSHAAVLESCRRLHMACVSLVAALHADIAAGGQPYFAGDIHWTRDGHRVAAGEILRLIAEIFDKD